MKSFSLLITLLLLLPLTSFAEPGHVLVIRGNVTDADGTGVGKGYTAKGVNQGQKGFYGYSADGNRHECQY